MSRDIKFRVWDKRIKAFTKARMDFMHLSGAKVIPIDKNGDLIWLQYTGLKDKNGVETYNGDIIKSKDFIGSIECELTMLEFIVNMHDGNYESLAWLKGYQNFEVIGNIYEHSHLLDNMGLK